MNLGGFQYLLYEAINEDVTFENDVNPFVKATLKPPSMINKLGLGNINVNESHLLQIMLWLMPQIRGTRCL